MLCTIQLGSLLLVLLGVLTQQTASRPVTTPSPEQCQSLDDGRYAVNQTCTSYLYCFQGKGSVRNCDKCPASNPMCAGQARMTFDPQSNRCIWPAQVCTNSCKAGCKPANAPSHMYLYVWAGADKNASGNDVLATFDMTHNSRTFGQLLTLTEVPTKGNEPHHMGISADGSVLGAGGLLGVLSGNPDAYFFKLDDPAKPTYWKSADAPQSAITDDFLQLPDGGFLVTMMGSASGGSPGRVVKFNSTMDLAGEYPVATLPTDNFNPHGIAADFKRNRLITTDFILPASTLLPFTALVFDSTVRIWDLDTMEILKTIDLLEEYPKIPHAGIMDAKLIGTSGIAYVSNGMGVLFAVHLTTYNVKPVITVASGFQFGPMLMSDFQDGKRMVVSGFASDVVQLIDTSKPWHPVMLQEVNLPTGAGPHFVHVSPDATQLVVICYFLDEDPAVGVVHLGGNKVVYIFDIVDGGNRLQANSVMPVIDFKSALGPKYGQARPHAAVFRVVA